MEKLLYSLRLTAIGMGVVFVALFLLSQMMYVLPLLAGGRKARVAKPAPLEKSAAIESSASVAESAAAAVENNGVAPEVIAVIATAIASYLGQTPENLNIVSIRRAPTSVGPWAMAARRESIQN